MCLRSWIWRRLLWKSNIFLFWENQKDSTVCSSNGTCTAADTCNCNSNYGGNNCQTSKCNGILATDGSVCSNHGSCDSVNNCKCAEGYTGINCEYSLCFGVASNIGTVCSWNMYCTWYLFM